MTLAAHRGSRRGQIQGALGSLGASTPRSWAAGTGGCFRRGPGGRDAESLLHLSPQAGCSWDALHFTDLYAQMKGG